MKRIPLIALTLCLGTLVVAQESIKSSRAEYLDLLALAGLAERPYINYQTQSDSTWNIPEAGHPWADRFAATNNPSRDLEAHALTTELYSSFNYQLPRGQNDGALWQGRGLNASLTGGIGASMGPVRATFKPMLAFSQNLPYRIMPAAYNTGSSESPNEYGYFWYVGVDAPQRFGNSPIYDFDWGDSELRATLPPLTIKGKTYDVPLTLAFGTQALWLGPARENPLLHSNNAPTYPRLDLGLSKTRTPVGNIEARSFWGALSESKYYNTNPDDDLRLLTGLSLSWEPIFAPGLSLGFHRTMLSKWANRNWGAMWTLLVPTMGDQFGADQNDQRASITADYLFPSIGFEAYLEWGKDDYSPNLDSIIRYPFHAAAYTAGIRKLFRGEGDAIWGVFEAEITNLESSRDYDFLWPASFYSHGIVTQGYTNDGQWLGAGIGTGGNSQRISYALYSQRGKLAVHLQRISKDSDYVWFKNQSGGWAARKLNDSMINATVLAGIECGVNISHGLFLKIGFDLYSEHNPFYDPHGTTSNIITDSKTSLLLSWSPQPHRGSEATAP
jgi:hypothetical protein